MAAIMDLVGNATNSAEHPAYSILDSPRIGGKCRMMQDAGPEFAYLTDDQLCLLRYAIYETQAANPEPLITADFVRQAVRRSRPNFEAMCLNILSLLSELTESLGSWVIFDFTNLDDKFMRLETLTLRYSRFRADGFSPGIMFFLNYLKEELLINLVPVGSQLRVFLNPKGMIHLQKTQRARSSADQAFVAMWFTDETKSVYDEAIDVAVSDAGYKAFRIDRHHYENKVDDEILAQIRQSRFVIADFTCGSVISKEGAKETENFIVRGGVYFEAGFALGLGIPVIWTVRQDRVASLHFDTNHYPHVVYADNVSLRNDLKNRIVALIGKGPREP